ncbi:VOC family protein [Tersicoccus sp. Bi-70]|uniref:VOC family protein n=1 Tax=Tersicoccus sp. Bi-70 TaxID=1897634 RepID=UPI000977832C|nr:VOC family protein [Tersicoccus sp. Bi-70]OMH34391.1 hypothetical protein BGP79_04620 [Tersicoccus sp. Bi-70]
MKDIITCLWFDGQALEAARFYASVFPDSRILTQVDHPDNSPTAGTGDVMVVEFELSGRHFVGLNGGPAFAFTEAVSLQIMCEDQAEVDHYWEALTADGGQESQCGWLKDKYGLSWQVTPVALTELLASADAATAQRITAAFMPMKKLDIATIEAAARG